MPKTYRRITKIVFLVLNILASVVFLLACLAPTLNPIQWWFISMLGLAFGFIVITLIAFILFWLVFKSRFVLISLLPMLIGYKSIGLFFAFHVAQKFNYEKEKNVLRVAHWNVARFVEWKRNNNKGSQTRLKMMDQIKEQNADVLCMQEFFTATDTTYYNNLGYISKEIGYPYYYFSWQDDGYLQWFGNVIFSRYPIVDSSKIFYPHGRYPETLMHIDILFHTDTVRIYTTHLQSLRFNKEDFETIEEIKDQKKIPLQNSKGVFSKVRRAMMLRKEQAEIIRDVMSDDTYPTILTGDFNDVPNSYAYATIRNDRLQDVFLQKGFGVGRTFNAISPTLRIDYILTTKDFESKQFNRIAKNLSDHYMLVADVVLKKNQK